MLANPQIHCDKGGLHGVKFLQFHWFRAIKFYNGLLSTYIATLKQALHADLSWCLGIKHIGLQTFCTRLRDCEAVTHTYKLSCRGTLFVTQISMLI